MCFREPKWKRFYRGNTIHGFGISTHPNSVRRLLCDAVGYGKEICNISLKTDDILEFYLDFGNNSLVFVLNNTNYGNIIPKKLGSKFRVKYGTQNFEKLDYKFAISSYNRGKGNKIELLEYSNKPLIN